MADLKFIVQKFGGTSVANAKLRELAAQKVIEARNQGYSPVVVVSAMGRQGEPYATDTLLSLVNDGTVQERELDLLMACGETISGIVLSKTLNRDAYPTVFLTGGQAGIITDDRHGRASIREVRPTEIIRLAKEGKIVVVAGFQGETDEGAVTTLGRGGSDTTAAALGVALNAEVVEIFTDVDGVMTADPRIVNNAKLISVVTYNEICQLAHEGAKVIHPRAVEIAMQKNIPIRIRSTFGDAPGTLVISHGEVMETTGMAGYGLLTGITNIPGVTQIKIFTRDYPEVKDVQVKIFKAMSLAGISVDFINVHPHAVIYTVKDEIADKAVQILSNMGFKAEVLPECAKVAVVGAGMTGIPGVMAGIVEALANAGVQILQSADSHTTIWVLVGMKEMELAVQALHDHFHQHFRNA